MELDFISYDSLGISTFDIKYIKDLSIENRINQHGSVKITGIIDEKVKDMYIHTVEEMTPIEVYSEKDNKHISLFNGVITSLKINVIDKVYKIFIEAKSITYIMDIYERKRSFQNTNMTSHNLIDKIMGEYKNIKYEINIPNEPIGEFTLQYNETDWEFLKRFLSKYNEGIINSIQSEKPKLFFGPPEIQINPKKHIKNYTVYKDINEYNDVKNNYIEGIKDTDFVIYRVGLDEIFNIGEKFTYIGRNFYIKGLKYDLKDSKLETLYDLSPRGGLKQKKLYNTKVIGISINGSILGVNRDRVKVKLDIDNASDSQSSYWFPYSTVAASPDGGGWYCMPEIGEKVRVYCPTKEEKKAIAISAIGAYSPKSKGNNDRMSNPEIKSLKTDSGQEVKFTPTGILIECDGGNAKMELNKDGSVNVTGQKNINIACTENLSLRAENELSILGEKSIDILCESGSSLIMDESEEITFTGTRVHNNG